MLFDPHATHLPVNAANPGKAIRLPNNPVLEQYPDQFAPYNVFGNEVGKSFPGTMSDSEQTNLAATNP